MRVDSGLMQRIYKTHLTPEEYHQQNAHEQVIADSQCPHCSHVGLHAHGTYERWISWLSRCLQIAIARFLCPACGHTVSYLPEFAFSYRTVNISTFEKFLEGHFEIPEVVSWLGVLKSYQRQAHSFARTLRQTVGSGLGIRPSETLSLWEWLKKACGSLHTATRQLVNKFHITLFNSYQCHQPVRG